METTTTNYAKLTKKQAGIVYSAVKSGKISMTKKDIAAMYDLVDKINVTPKEIGNILRYKEVCGLIVKNNISFAQGVADGGYIYNVEIGTTIRYATAEDWFYDLGEAIQESIFEEQVLTREQAEELKNQGVKVF